MPVKAGAADFDTYCIMFPYETAHFGFYPCPRCIVGAVCFSQHALPTSLVLTLTFPSPSPRHTHWGCWYHDWPFPFSLTQEIKHEGLWVLPQKFRLFQKLVKNDLKFLSSALIIRRSTLPIILFLQRLKCFPFYFRRGNILIIID